MSAVTVLFAALCAAPAAEAKRPNVVILLSDDMGFSDIGCYGGEIRTPNLDALAENGLRFTQFYNTARCCPTRASLLTGLYPHQAGVGHMMADQGHDGYRGDLNRRCVTLAEALKPAGYAAYAVGKWHVTKAVQPVGPKDNWPLQRGLERFYGTIGGAGSYYDPSSLVRDNTMISAYADPEYRPKTFYYTDAIRDHAVRFLAEHVKAHKDKPFLLYVAFTVAHWPMHALPEDVARYKGKYDDGYQPVREARFKRAAKLGVIDARQRLGPPAVKWDEVKDKKREAACMEVYAAMVDRMDQAVGGIVAELRRTGQLDNTLVLYLQDNGGCAEPMGRNRTKGHPSGPRLDKPSLPPLKPDFLQTGSVPLQTRDGYPVRQGPDVYPGPYDTYVAYGRGWASVSNTPFREYKHWVHEGGISTPLIAHWPEGITKERRGQLVRDPGHLIDVMATCADVAGAKYPESYKGVNIQPMEGVSLAPAFAGKPVARKEPLFWEHEGNKAARFDDWKLVAKHEGEWELYDLDADRTERRDLAKKRPSKVKVLAAKWDEWAKRAGVRPWPVARKK